MPSLQALKLILLLVSLVLFNGFAHAADSVAGKDKANLCLGCHGSNGNSKTPIYPSLAGQSAQYVFNQLKAFKSEQRNNPVMQSMASRLTEEDMKNIATYFSSLTTESAGGDPSLVSAGQAKFAMCAGCHGATAQGRSGFPKLAGQQPEYLEKQLLNFKNGSRKGGPMNSITSYLSEKDIKGIVAYLGSLK